MDSFLLIPIGRKTAIPSGPLHGFKKQNANPAFLCLVNAGGYSLGGCGGAGSCALVPNPLKQRPQGLFFVAKLCLTYFQKHICLVS